MGGKFSRNKGQRAEREVCDLLQPLVDKVYSEFGYVGVQVPKLKRNLAQTQDGGYDVSGLVWLSLEVKHQEKLQVDLWWQQTLDQTGAGQTSVLFYKQNRVKWLVRIECWVPVGSSFAEGHIRCPGDIKLEAFLVYFEHRLRLELS